MLQILLPLLLVLLLLDCSLLLVERREEGSVTLMVALMLLRRGPLMRMLRQGEGMLLCSLLHCHLRPQGCLMRNNCMRRHMRRIHAILWLWPLRWHAVLILAGICCLLHHCPAPIRKRSLSTCS